MATDNENPIGYICCSPNTINDKELFELSAPIGMFKEFYHHFPAHLHINCLPLAQGKGVGTQLLEALCKDLIRAKICGVHLITGSNERNVSFYTKNNFSLIHKINNLVMLGKNL